MRMNKKGFTLVELMVVLAILGLLAGIGIPSYMNVLERARVGTDIARIAQAQASINAFVAEIGGWGNAGTIAAGVLTKFTTAQELEWTGGVTGIEGFSIITGEELDLAMFFDDPLGAPSVVLDSEDASATANEWYISTSGLLFVGGDATTVILPPTVTP